ncbi:MAG: hypothetical protein J6Y28_09855 [Acholeplasmatales bacterium]|nr:hypothetical protein [Methanobrevibacter sp.]MBP5446463.1 hypothetical protein [Acholeplasmatales bacterium]
MEHCYIFDFTSASIYHIKLPEDVEDIESYLCETYGLKSNQLSFMVTDEKLTIEDL